MPIFHTAKRNPTVDVIRHGLDFACSLAAKNNTNACVILTDETQNIKNHRGGPSLDDALIDSLLNNSATHNGCRCYLKTQQAGLTDADGSTIVFALHPSPSWLSAVIDRNPEATFVYAPWTADELDQFIESYPSATQI